jgi:hypothetical protein
MSIDGVTRELLVRYLDAWTPVALHAGRRVTFVQASAGAADPSTAEAALRVFGEFADRLRGRELRHVVVAPDAAGLSNALDAVLGELGAPAGLTVHAVAAPMSVVLKAVGAAGAPLLSFVDSVPAPPASAGKPADALLIAPAGDWPAQRAALREAGYPLTAGVELLGPDEQRLFAFATGQAKQLEAFKNALWAVDEYAGVRYRDPGDPAGAPMDISLEPNPGPLRRELLAHLAQAGERTVTELKHYTMTDTVYRAADATRVLTALLHASTVERTPDSGRLAGDTIIRLRSAPTTA